MASKGALELASYLLPVLLGGTKVGIAARQARNQRSNLLKKMLGKRKPYSRPSKRRGRKRRRDDRPTPPPIRPPHFDPPRNRETKQLAQTLGGPFLGVHGCNIAKPIKRGKSKLSKKQVFMSNASGQFGSNKNECYYAQFTAFKLSDYTGLMDNLITIGQTDAQVTREETYDLNASSSNGLSRIWIVQDRMVYTIRNNYLHSVNIHAYWYSTKKDGSNAPREDMIPALDDIAGSDAGWETSVNVYPGHARHLKSYHKLHKSDYVRLDPGQEVKFVYTNGGYWLSGDYIDQVSDEYQRRLRSGALLLRVEGSVIHDSTTDTLVAIGDTKLDYVCKRSVSYRFSAETNQVQRYETSDNLDSVSSGRQVHRHNPELEAQI